MLWMTHYSCMFHDGGGAQRQNHLSNRYVTTDQLDLSYSLPYSIARRRWCINERATELEEFVRSLDEQQNPALRGALVSANAELAQLRQTMGHVQTQVAGSSLGEQLLILMADWEHFARTFGATNFGTSTLQVDDRMYDRADLLLSPYGVPYTMPQWTQAFAMGEHFDALSDALYRGASNLRAHVNAIESPLQHGSGLVLAFEQRFAAIRARSEARAVELVHKAGEAVHEVEEMLHRAAVDLAAEGRRLIEFKHLPQVWRNNDCIHTGYRFIPVHNWRLLLRSIFQMHNETVNIQTHLWGLILLFPMYMWFKSHDEHTTKMDEFVQFLYIVAAAKCMLCSVSWHVMAGCSDKHWFNCFSCIDYTGISLLVSASLQTVVYNGFYCQPDIVMAYTIGVLTITVTMTLLPWAPWFNDRRYRSLRISTFIFMALTGIVPFIHSAFMHDLRKIIHFYRPILWSLLSYCVGVFLYFNRLPERLAPGRFDYIGHSHQLWHVTILVAIVLHYRAVLHFHHNRFEYSCRAVPGSDGYNMPDSWLLAQASRISSALVRR